MRKIKSWIKMQALLGKLGRDSVKHRIGRFKPPHLNPHNGTKAEEELHALSIVMVHNIDSILLHNIINIIHYICLF